MVCPTVAAPKNIEGRMEISEGAAVKSFVCCVIAAVLNPFRRSRSRG
jgi:hypothetical protein